MGRSTGVFGPNSLIPCERIHITFKLNFMETKINNEHTRVYEHSTNEWFYEDLSGSPYWGWVSAYKRGTLTRGQVKYRVQNWIRVFGKNNYHPTVSYKEWLVWMTENHEKNLFDHILG